MTAPHMNMITAKGSSIESFGRVMFGGSSIKSHGSYSEYSWMGKGYHFKQKGSRELLK